VVGGQESRTTFFSFSGEKRVPESIIRGQVKGFSMAPFPHPGTRKQERGSVSWIWSDLKQAGWD